jgi:uncharacterized membrane protein
MRLIQANKIRHMLYVQRGGYIVLPVLIMMVLSLVAGLLPILERDCKPFSIWAIHASWLPPRDPGMAQLLLGAIAGSCITVVSVVYSVLLIALTFASIQFSPRVLNTFVKDTVSQVTLGVFIGTFAYCLILLPSIHGPPQAVVPALSLTVALVLAAGCLFYLIYFIHHIAVAIQVNYIVDRVARETETALRNRFGRPMKRFPVPEPPLPEPTAGKNVLSHVSGYVQYIDENKLLNLAGQANATIFIHRWTGQFIPAGVACFTITPAAAASKQVIRSAVACFHIGPVRSLEDDVEFGVLQIVDIALKALSPATNDPSTAISCIDQLSTILVMATALEPPKTIIVDKNNVPRVFRRQTSFPRLLEVAFNQLIRHSGGDMPVALRMLRALHDISGVTNCLQYLTVIRNLAQKIVDACTAHYPPEECGELHERLSIIEKRQRTN